MIAALLLAAVAGTPTEQRILAAVNEARTRPARTAEALRRYAATFDGRTSHEDGADSGWATVEGATPVLEAADVLARQAPLAALSPAPLLARAARSLAEEQSVTGAIGHRSADQRRAGDRARAAGGGPYVTEVIAYGFETPERGARQMLVDDGIVGRGHRVLLMSPRARYAGVACAPHPRLRVACVVVMSETPDGQPVLPPSGP